MSASLVGSEMCIRDRPPRAPRGRPKPPGAPRACRARRGPLGASRAAPVSYTHLTLPTICSV
eukprot:8714195-Alexandrium_andersonii.AAC.1